MTPSAVTTRSRLHRHGCVRGELSFVQETRIYRWVVSLAGALTF